MTIPTAPNPSPSTQQVLVSELDRLRMDMISTLSAPWVNWPLVLDNASQGVRLSFNRQLEEVNDSLSRNQTELRRVREHLASVERALYPERWTDGSDVEHIGVDYGDGRTPGRNNDGTPAQAWMPIPVASCPCTFFGPLHADGSPSILASDCMIHNPGMRVGPTLVP